MKWPDGKGPNMILDDGGDATLLVHKGVAFNKTGKVPAPTAKDSEEYQIILRLLADCRPPTASTGPAPPRTSAA